MYWIKFIQTILTIVLIHIHSLVVAIDKIMSLIVNSIMSNVIVKRIAFKNNLYTLFTYHFL
jgi:membrane associated rhomboid family serine protease